MTLFYVFNGDADGLCALQQLRLVNGREGSLVTGVKRDIRLLRTVYCEPGDAITVLDISLDENRADLLRLLDAGAAVRYFDHHHAGVVPSHPGLEAYIQEAPDVCTSSLVDSFLNHRHQGWAAVAAYGDNLRELGLQLATSADIAADAASLERLGILLNYNAYGSIVGDLLFNPAELARLMLPFRQPLDFIRGSPAYDELGIRYDDDMRRARRLRPRLEIPGALLMELPDEAWARRAVGVLANTLIQERPESAIATAVPNGGGGYAVSVRVPDTRQIPADEFCRNFPTGNGRSRAAGINHLPSTELGRFAQLFQDRFRSDR